MLLDMWIDSEFDSVHSDNLNFADFLNLSSSDGLFNVEFQNEVFSSYHLFFIY